MEQAVKRRARRNRPSLPLALLAAVVVLSIFGVVAASRRPEAVAPPPSEFTISTPAPLITPPPSAAETPAPYVPDEAEVEMLARVLWGEARGVPSDMEKAAVVWCVLNRVDAARWPDTVAGVVTEPLQFAGLSGHGRVKSDCRGRSDTVGAGAAGRRRRGPRPSRGILLLYGRRGTKLFPHGIHGRRVLGLDVTKPIQQLTERSY